MGRKIAGGGGGVLAAVVDAAVGAALVAALWVPSLLMAGDVVRVLVGALLAVLVLASCGLRWRLTFAAPLLALLSTALGWLLGVCTDPMLGAAWCVYPAAVRRAPRLGAIVISGAGLLAAVAALAAVPDAGGTTRVFGSVVTLGTSVVLGSFEGRRVQAVAEQAEAEAAEQRAVSQLSLSRDVHDVVGHALSVISAEAGVARSIPGASEHELRESLADIEHRSRSALEQVQSLVRSMRTGSTGIGGPPGVNDRAALVELVAAARLSGLDVTARINLPDATVAGSVAVWVVREALSNVVRHAGARRCEVAIWPQEHVLAVRVGDDGQGFPVGWEPGSGLAGMRERVEQAGGSLTVTGRGHGGGVQVLAELPLSSAP